MKLNDDDTDIKSYRILRLNQFINIYKHLKQQMDTLKMFNQEKYEPGMSKLESEQLEDNARLYDS